MIVGRDHARYGHAARAIDAVRVRDVRRKIRMGVVQAGVDVTHDVALGVAQGLGDQFRFAGPLAVEGGLAASGAGGYRVHGQGLVADLAEEV